MKWAIGISGVLVATIAGAILIRAVLAGTEAGKSAAMGIPAGAEAGFVAGEIGSRASTEVGIDARESTPAGISSEGGSAEPEKPVGKAEPADKTAPPKEPVEKLIVPVISLGDGARIGAVQIAGPRSYVQQVKAVVVLEGDYKDIVRYRALIPIKTEKVIQKIERVPFVAVTGIVDLKVS